MMEENRQEQTIANHRRNERTRIRILETNYIRIKKRSHDFKRDIFNELHKQPIQCNRKNQNTWILNQTIINRMNFFFKRLSIFDPKSYLHVETWLLFAQLLRLQYDFSLFDFIIFVALFFLHKNPTITIIVHRNRLTVNFIDQNCVNDVTFNKYVFNCCL